MTDEAQTPEPEQAPAPPVTDPTPEPPEIMTAETPAPPQPIAEHPVPADLTPSVDEAAIHHSALGSWFLEHEHALADKVRTAVQTELEALHKYLTALKDRLTSHL